MTDLGPLTGGRNPYGVGEAMRLALGDRIHGVSVGPRGVTVHFVGEPSQDEVILARHVVEMSGALAVRVDKSQIAADDVDCANILIAAASAMCRVWIGDDEYMKLTEIGSPLDGVVVLTLTTDLPGRYRIWMMTPDFATGEVVIDAD